MPVQFGKRDPDKTYIDRPGAYGIALEGERTLLVVAVDDLLALPGGGLLPGETFEDGLKREFREETGFPIRILRPLGAAGQYVYARDEGLHFNKLCHFFQVQLIGDRGVAKDKDHEPVWMAIEQAAATLTEEAHRWAVSKVLND